MAKILAIDDNKDNLIVLSALLAESFPEIVFLSSTSGVEGIKLCHSENPDVVLLDIVMPQMDGFEVCQILKANEATKTIPIALITAGRADKENRIKALECGVDAFLTKPLDESELTALIRVMLRIRESEELIRNEKEQLIRLVDERTEALQKELRERRQAQEALQDSEEKHSILFMNSPDSYLIIKDGVFIDCNRATENMLGGDRSKIIGQTPDAVSPEYQPDGKKSSDSAREKIADALKHGKKTFEWLHRRFDGSDLYVEVSIAPMKLKGSLTLFTTWRDISVRKKAEQALLESEAQFREFFEKAADAIFIADLETGILLDANEASSKLMLMPHDQLVGLHQSQLHPPINKSHTHDTYTSHTQAIIHHLPALPVENLVVRSDGKLVPVEVLASEVFRNGRRCIMGTFRDISRRKKAEELLRESEYFFKESQRAAFVGSYKFDLVADSWTSSEVLDQIFGIDANQIRNLQSWVEILHPDDREMMVRYLNEEVIAKRQSFNKEYRIVSQSDGEIRWVLGLGKLKMDDQDKVIEMIGTIQDITERIQAEQARNESYEFNQSLLKTIPFDMNIVDESGNVLFQSARLEDAFGQQALGCKCFEMYRDGKSRCDHCPLVEGIQIGKTSVYESSGIMGGRIFEIIHTGMMFKGKKALLEIFMDITDRKLAEEALIENNSKLELAMKVANMAWWEMDLASGNVTFSPRKAEMLDYPPEKFKHYTDFTALVHPDDYEGNMDAMRLHLKGERERYESEYRIRTLSGEYQWFYDVGTITRRDSNGFPQTVAGLVVNITERKEAEQVLLEREILFQGLFNASPESILLIDPHHPDISWPILDCNAASCRMNGYTREEMIGQSIDLLNVTLGSVEERIAYIHMLRQQKVIHAESCHKHKDGHVFPIEVTTSLITIAGKEMILGIDRDITERKQAEEALIKSEERYRSFISQVSEGVYRFESDVPMDLNLPVEEQIDFIYDHMFIDECNDALIRMYGISEQKEMIGKSHLDFHGGRHNPVNRETFRTFIRNGYVLENAITEEQTTKGQIIHISNNTLGIIEHDQLVRIWGTQTDVTEKMRTEQVQQVIFAISSAALSTTSLPELIELISKEVGKLLDAKNFFIAFYDEKTDQLSTLYERDEKDEINSWPAKNSITGYVIKKNKSLLLRDTEMDQFHAEEGILPLGTLAKVWLGVPLTIGNRTIGAIVVQSYENPDAYTRKDLQMLEFVSHQIGISIERKRTEQDLKLMGKAFDQSPVTIVITNKEGNIEYINPKFTESTGFTLDEVKGKNPSVIQSGNQSREYYSQLWETILTGHDWFGEFQNKRKNGELYWESAVISPITNESGEIAFFMAIKEDITEKKQMIDDLIQAKNKAQESDRLKSSFLANMSHEIRTPLNSIIGFSELLLDEDFGVDQHEEFARTINSSGNSLLTIISDIMDLSKIEAGQIQVVKKSFSVHKLMNEIYKEYSYKTAEKGIELRFDPGNPADDFYIESDEQRIKQVLINFIGNAIKFTEKGFIDIGFENLGGSVKFQVRDTGIGISEEFHREIFERFRQVEVSNTRKYGGNGLGLAISKSLIDLLGGNIGLESEKEKGSTFYFTIPVS